MGEAVTFEAAAVAEWEAWKAAQDAAAAAELQAAQDALVTAAWTAVLPALTTHDAKVPVAPKDFTVSHVDVEHGVVVLTSPSGGTDLLVQEDGTVRLTALDEGEWRGDLPVVERLADVGAHKRQEA